MEISVIASGSNGNCTLVEHNGTSVLIDAGKSCKEIESRMNQIGKSLENVDALLLTHAHIDHYQSIGVISRKYNLPAFMTKETYKQCSSYIGGVISKNFSVGKEFKIGKIDINPINTSHDVPSCGFVIGKFGLFTDTGTITPHMSDAMKGLKGVLLESNHDIDLLLKGRYPFFLKQRILSDNGHLSNIHASTFVNEHASNLDWVLLGHLSGNNNTPEKASETFESLVSTSRLDYEVLSRNALSGTWDL